MENCITELIICKCFHVIEQFKCGNNELDIYVLLLEVRKRIPGFSPTRVLDFGAGTGSAMW